MIDLSTRPSSGAPDEPPRFVKPITIRPMRLEDIEHVSRLERRCYALPWSSSAYATEVGNPSAYYTVAVDGHGAILGYAGMWVIMDEAHLTTIAVGPEERGQKIGERLLADLLETGIERGAERATLEVREKNTIAHGLYRKFGFEDVAIRKHYYSDNGENAIIMWANDLTSPAYRARMEAEKRKIIVREQD